MSIVCELVKHKLKIIISPGDISTAHRLGKKPANQQPNKRNLIVKVCRRDLKRDILTACRSLKPRLFVNESLTPMRNSIMYVLRHAKRKPNRLVGCSSLDGRVFAWIKKDDDAGPHERNLRVPINTQMKLDTFCRDVLHEPVTNVFKGG